MCDQKNATDNIQKIADEAELDSLSASDDSESDEQIGSTPFDPDTYSSNDEDEDEGEVQIIAPPAGQRPKSLFSLKGGSSGFSNRSHSIFGSLDSAAKLASSSLGQDNVIDGVFVRPLPPAALRSKLGRTRVSSSTTPAKKEVPDYLMHPERWTHYNLEDVAETSDRSNRMVAHQFLASLKQKKEVQECSSPVLSQCLKSGSTTEKIIFSKPCRPGREQPADEPSPAKDKDTQMLLSHLKEEEDEEGSERGRARLKRMHGCIENRVEKAKETAEGVSHLEGEDEEKKKAAVRPPDAEDGGGRKREKQGGDVEEEEKQVGPQFVSFKKPNRKNYRKTSEDDER